MGKRIFAAGIVLIVILAGLIYFEGKYAVVSAKVLGEKVQADTRKETEEVEKAPVAFGYISHGEKIQIVGLMSREDEAGILKGYLDRLCQKRKCNVEIDYKDNIKDAPWQDSLVDLFEVIQSDDFDNGALFIEAGQITLKGKVQKEEIKELIADILNRLHQEGLKVVPSALVKSLHRTKLQEQNNTTIQIITENNISHKGDDINLSFVQKEPVQNPELNQSKQKEIIPAHIVKKKEQRHKPKVIKKRHKKKRVQARKKHYRDIIAPSYMETTIDLERKIKSQKGIKGSRKDDMIAEPKMTIIK